MTLAQLRHQALARFGIQSWDAEHPVLTWGVVRNAINQAHRWFAARTLCYYEHDRSEALAQGTARYALDADVIRIDPNSVRVNVGGSYTQLVPRVLGSLLVQYGALEGVAQATPTFFVAEMGGEANDETAALRLVPTPSAVATLYYGAWVYPAELSAETDRPRLADAEQHRLLAPICWKLAEALSQAGETADPAYWLQLAEQEVAEFSALLHGGGQRQPRMRGRDEMRAPAAGGGRRR